MEAHRKNYVYTGDQPVATASYEEKDGGIQCKISIFKLAVGNFTFPQDSVSIVLTQDNNPSHYSRRLLEPYGISGDYTIIVQKQYANTKNNTLIELQGDAARFEQRTPIPPAMAVDIIENMIKVCGKVQFHIVNPTRQIEPEVPAKRQKVGSK